MFTHKLSLANIHLIYLHWKWRVINTFTVIIYNHPKIQQLQQVDLQIPHDIHTKMFEKLTDEIKHKFAYHSFEVSLLAKQLAELTEMEDAVSESHVMKSLLID